MNRGNILIVVWLILGSAALLTRMGLAFFHGGVSRSKNVASAGFRAVMDVCLGALIYWAIGAAIQSGSSIDLFNVSRNVSSLLIVGMALMASGAVVGSTLERSRAIVPMVGSVLMCGLVVPLGWQWAHGAWLARLGFSDLAGATFIHFAGGCAAAVAAICVGARTGKYNRDGSTNVFLGHSVAMMSVGVLLMFLGWIPYLCGCIWMNSQTIAGQVVFNAVLAGAAGACAAALLGKIRSGKFDILSVFTGLIAGLISITAAADRLPAPLAVACGAIAGLIVPWFAGWLDMFCKIDDPAGAIAMQGIGGLWAALAPALFIPGSIEEHLHRLAGQCAGLAIIGVLSTGVILVAMGLLRVTGSVRCTEAEEFDGLDLSQHDQNAYPDFQQTTIKSYHLREM